MSFSPRVAQATLSSPQLRHAIIPCAAILILGIGLWLIYPWVLPRPLPGIPYNRAASKSILGDIREIRRSRLCGTPAVPWILNLCSKHASPLVQIFIGGLCSKPTLVLGDFEEASRFLVKGDKYLDQSTRTRENIGGVIPNYHLAMSKSNPQFKVNRQIASNLMSPAFLNGVAAPQIFEQAKELVDIWIAKSHAAQGRPFYSESDISIVSYVALRSIAFGPTSANEFKSYTETLKYLGQGNRVQILIDKEEGNMKLQDEPFSFPECPAVQQYHVTQKVEAFISRAQAFPYPRMVWYVLRFLGIVRKYVEIRDEHFEQVYAAAKKRVERSDFPLSSGLDYMIHRAELAAQRKDVQSVMSLSMMRDEMTGYVSVGHRTIAQALRACLGHLSANPATQCKLRDALRFAIPDAMAQGRQPTVSEILGIKVPYLNAVIEETLRLSSPSLLIAREATADTIILGHHIPKGTQILVQLTGPSITSPHIPTDSSENDKTPPSRPRWTTSDIGIFIPERWLKTDAENSDETVFHCQAGPNLAFAAGSRGCSGKRLAYLALRILTVIIVWNFELQGCPESLQGDIGKLVRPKLITP